MNILLLIPALIIMMRCVCIAANTSRAEFDGHPLTFVGISIGYPLLGGGAVGVALGWQHAPIAMLIGMAVLVLSDRRHYQRR